MTHEQLAELRRVEQIARTARWAAERDEKDAQIAVMQAEKDLGLRPDDAFFQNSMQHMAWIRNVYAAFADGDSTRGNAILMANRAPTQDPEIAAGELAGSSRPVLPTLMNAAELVEAAEAGLIAE